jgi:hypothetical protein
MTTSSMFESLGLATQQLYLEIPAMTANSAAFSTATFSTAAATRRAYLNQICLNAIQDWFQTDNPLNINPNDVKVWPNVAALPSFWEIVNGTVLTVGQQRFCLLPTEAIEADELRVPQEWIDIPGWLADYYLLLQVDSDEGYVQVVGYTTHAELKTKGQYDADDRSYRLNVEDLIADINVIGLAQEFCAAQTLRTAVPALATIAQAQAQQLLTRLASAEQVMPRLAIPFSLWGGLMAHGGWRQRLYEQRQGLPEQWSVSQWLQTGFSELVAQFGWDQGNLAAAPVMLGSRSLGAGTIGLTRQLTIAQASYQLQITPQTIDPPAQDQAVWRFTLSPSDPNQSIPTGFTLRLLSEDLQPFENNSDTAIAPVAQLYVDVILAAGEGIVWEVEPQPEGYDREILRF